MVSTKSLAACILLSLIHPTVGTVGLRMGATAFVCMCTMVTYLNLLLQRLSQLISTKPVILLASRLSSRQVVVLQIQQMSTIRADAAAQTVGTVKILAA